MFNYGLGTAVTLTQEGNLEGLSKFLSSHHMIVHESNKAGNTCLHVAAHKGRLDICLMLLLRGAKIDAADKQAFTPLMVALQFQHCDVANMLIERGASVVATNAALYTPLHIAAIFGAAASVPMILDHGADVNALDSNGHSPLVCAVKKAHTEIALLLLEKRANVMLEDNRGETALAIARHSGQISLVTAISAELERQTKELRLSMQASQLAPPRPGARGLSPAISAAGNTISGGSKSKLKAPGGAAATFSAMSSAVPAAPPAFRPLGPPMQPVMMHYPGPTYIKRGPGGAGHPNDETSRFVVLLTEPSP